jgi:asparagine synthase (glutamine-hydrolysing)
MCGIFGVVSTKDPIDVRGVVRASAALRHRGPDGDGVLLGDGAGVRVMYGEDPVPDRPYRLALAHRRLSIIDLSGGAQPLANEDGTVWAMLNGEIYNYRELRDELSGRGHAFTTKSDTEVLCHGWEEWGVDLVHRLHGMFAFAVHDTRRDVLALFRDHAGVKPLYYYVGDGVFAFASEIKALLAYAPDIEVSRENVFDFFLFGQVPVPGTPFRSVFRLDAGERCVVRCRDLAVVEKTKYWDFAFRPVAWRSRDDVVAAVDDTLQRVVAKQAVADVGVATFLSGGIDSSLITRALMTQSADVTAFHMYPRDGSSERKWTANPGFGALHQEHVAYEPSLESCVDALANVDALLFDPGVLPMYLVSRAAAQAGFKVVLSGDGGDEMFAGYDQVFAPAYLFERYRHLGVGVWGRFPLLRYLMNAGDAEQLARYCREGSCLPVYATRINDLLSARKAGAAGAARRLPGDGLVPTGPDDRRSDLERLAYFYCRYVMNVILEKVDVASMANSLEVRVPLLDVEMMTLALSIPFEHKMPRRGKYPLKAIAARHFGAAFAYRSKQGFLLDVDSLFRDRAVEDHLRRNLEADGVEEFLDVRSVAALLAENRTGAAHGRNLWRALMFTEWYRNWGARHV